VASPWWKRIRPRKQNERGAITVTSDYAAAVQATGLEPNDVRQAVFRLLQHFLTLLRQIVADTLAASTGALIDEELAALRSDPAARDSRIIADGADRRRR
jgi:hypothetical protein